MHQDVTWYGARPQPRGLCVRWGPSTLPKKGAEPPKFSAHVYCDQTAGWIKMALGMEVGLSTCDFELDGDPAPSAKRGLSPRPIFGKFLQCPNGRMHHDALGMEVGLSPGDFVFNGDPAPLPKRGQSPQIFGPCLL